MLRLPKEETLGPTPKSISDIPNELILQIVESLSLTDISRLFRTNHFFQQLLSPVFLKRLTTPIIRLGKQRRTLLHWAAAHDRGPLMKKLLERGKWINQLDEVDVTGLSALHSAVIRGYETPVKLLIENGANLEIMNDRAFTPLMFAAHGGNSTMTRLLIEGGANIESRCGGSTALHHAAAMGHIDVVSILVEMGCNTGAVDTHGMDAVQIAAFFGQNEVVKRLGPGGSNATPDLVFNSDLINSEANMSRLFRIQLNFGFYESSLNFDKDYCMACQRVRQ